MNKISLALIIVVIASAGLMFNSMATKTDSTKTIQAIDSTTTNNTQLLSDEELQKKIKARR